MKTNMCINRIYSDNRCLVTIDAYSLIHQKQTKDEQQNSKIIGLGPTEKMRVVIFLFFFQIVSIVENSKIQ